MWENIFSDICLSANGKYEYNFGAYYQKRPFSITECTVYIFNAIVCEFSCKLLCYLKSLLKEDNCPKMQMIVVSWQQILLRQKLKYIYSQ